MKMYLWKIIISMFSSISISSRIMHTFLPELKIYHNYFYHIQVVMIYVKCIYMYMCSFLQRKISFHHHSVPYLWLQHMHDKLSGVLWKSHVNATPQSKWQLCPYDKDQLCYSKNFKYGIYVTALYDFLVITRFASS